MKRGTVVGLGLHPDDQERWADVVIGAHRANADVTDEELYGAFELIQDDTWQAQRVREYNWGRSLLKRNAES